MFWPGLMNADALGQWYEMLNWDWLDQQPTFHTFCNWLATRLWYSAGAVALLQIVALDAIAGWALVRMHAMGLPGWLAALVCLANAPGPSERGLGHHREQGTHRSRPSLLVLTMLVLETVHSRERVVTTPVQGLGGTRLDGNPGIGSTAL